MAVRTTAASARKRTKPPAVPLVVESAPRGDVRLGARVSLAPGTSIRADEGTPFHLGDDTLVQEGVVLHGLEKSRVVGDDGQEYSIWIGRECCLTHLVLVHGPAYVGDRCFIGFRSTVFNSRVGEDCIVMMHALIQDVEIPPGKFVPSGAVITAQSQADRLPNVTEGDRLFARNIIGIAGTDAGRPRGEPPIDAANETLSSNSGKPMSLQTNIRSQIRSLLSQGYRIGVEHADKRRFKTGSWLSAGFLEGNREESLANALEIALKDLPGEYVRLIGIDPVAKRRVLEMIVQRPEDTPGEPTRTTTAVHAAGNGAGGSDVSVPVRSLLAQGFKIGTEHADKRRFKTGSWLTGPTLESRNETAIAREIEDLLREHADEYVRLIGIDPIARKRAVEIIIQRPGESRDGTGNGSHREPPGNGRKPEPTTSGSLGAATLAQIRSLLSQGYRIGTEHADKRRFKTSSWLSCTPIDARSEPEVIAALESCMQEHAGEYVRLLGIDPKARRRVLEAVIQRPDGPAVHDGATRIAAPRAGASVEAPRDRGTRGATVTGILSGETLQQIRSLLASGYKIGSEHADKRRFKTGSWLGCAPIENSNEPEVIAALESCLQDHRGEYVRLIGIDPKAKKRVLETVIQRP